MGARPRLVKIEESGGCYRAFCACGFATLPRTTRDAARLSMDTHKQQAHPRQWQYVQSKRKVRTGR